MSEMTGPLVNLLRPRSLSMRGDGRELVDAATAESDRHKRHQRVKGFLTACISAIT